MKNKIKSIFLLLTIFPLYLTGQVVTLSSTITDMNGEPLQLANIMILNHQLGTTSDKNGYFELKVPDSLKYDTIVISYIGYHSTRICIIDLKDTLTLATSVFQLPAVYVKHGNNKYSKPLFINKFKKRKCFLRYTSYDSINNIWIPFRPNEPTIETIFFPNTNKNYSGKRIKEIRIYLTTFKIPATFRLRIYSANKNAEPKFDLLKTPITSSVNKSNSLIIINLEKNNLIFPKNGIFVGVELLIIPQNKTTINTDGNKYTIYSPYLNFIRTKEKGRFWQYTEGKWIKNNSLIPEFTNINSLSYYKPAITLVLTE